MLFSYWLNKNLLDRFFSEFLWMFASSKNFSSALPSHISLVHSVFKRWITLETEKKHNHCMVPKLNKYLNSFQMPCSSINYSIQDWQSVFYTTQPKQSFLELLQKTILLGHFQHNWDGKCKVPYFILYWSILQSNR